MGRIQEPITPKVYHFKKSIDWVFELKTDCEIAMEQGTGVPSTLARLDTYSKLIQKQIEDAKEDYWTQYKGIHSIHVNSFLKVIEKLKKWLRNFEQVQLTNSDFNRMDKVIEVLEEYWEEKYKVRF